MTELTKQLFDGAGIEPKYRISGNNTHPDRVFTKEELIQWFKVVRSIDIDINNLPDYVEEIYPDLESNTPEAAWNREKLRKVITKKFGSITSGINKSNNKWYYQTDFYAEYEEWGWHYEAESNTEVQALLSLAIKLVDEIKDELQAVEWGW